MNTELATNGKRAAAAAAPAPAPTPPRPYTIADLQVLARNIAESKFFDMTPPQAFTLMLLCMSEGLDPIQATRRYHIIHGRPTMRSDAMQAEWQRKGGSIEWIEETDAGCVAIFRHPRYAPRGHRVAFTEEDARRAELLGRETWRHYPASMYRARVISMGIRKLDPSIVVGIYTPEEMQDALPEAPARPDPRPWRGPRAAPVAEAGEAGPRPGPAPAPTEATGPAGPDPTADVKRFIRAEVEAARAQLRHALRESDKDETGHEQVTNEHQVANHLLTQWIQDGLIQEEEVLNDDGKRDRARGGIAVLKLYRDLKDDVEADIREYVHHKRDEAFRARGLEPPGGRDEDQAKADDDPAGGAT